METFSSYSSQSKFIKLTKNTHSNFPTTKIVAVAACVFTLSGVNNTVNQGTINTSSLNKTKRSYIRTFDYDNSLKSLPVNNKKDGGDKMSNTEIKLNEVQKYFDEKISDVKESIHNIDKRLSVMENELGHVAKSLDSIPKVIESSVQLTLDKIEKEKKVKWWDRYGGPIITGVIVAIITVGGPFLLKLLNIIK